MILSDCSCYYDIKVVDSWIKADNSACWAGIKDEVLCKYNSDLIRIRLKDTELDVDKNLLMLTRVINKITPCYYEKDYIYYTIIGKGKTYYDRNLFLLNFIRYLWNMTEEPCKKRQTIFFDTLRKSRYKDPMKRLIKANIAVSFGIVYSPGHSNLQNPKKQKLLTTEEFLANEKAASNFF